MVLAVLTVWLVAWPVEGIRAENGDGDDGPQFTFYIAVGGACGGLFWYLAYQSGFLPYNPMDRPALANYGTDGFQWGVPMLGAVDQGPDAGAPYLQLIHVRF
jgi:hypothetical protein